MTRSDELINKMVYGDNYERMKRVDYLRGKNSELADEVFNNLLEIKKLEDLINDK